MSQYFPKSYEPFGGDINVKVDRSNYATKSDIKNISHVEKTNYNTKVAEIDTKLSRIDGKITKNKNELDKTTSDTVLPVFGNMLFNSEDGSQAYLNFSQYIDILKRLPILIIFYNGNLEDYLLKVLSHLQHLIIVLIQN